LRSNSKASFSYSSGDGTGTKVNVGRTGGVGVRCKIASDEADGDGLFSPGVKEGDMVGMASVGERVTAGVIA
jgi:hypothetical protein